jgi:hypothetical protein
MPVTTCGSSTVLTGQDGMIMMKPPGTFACLYDFVDFPAPVNPATESLIKVPRNSDFRVNDPVVFTEKGTASLDSELTEGTVYYIVSRAPESVTIATTVGGTAMALEGDGGTGSANTPGAGNHIEMSFAAAAAMCEVPSVTLTLTRGEIDRTALRCKPSAALGGPKLAQFRKFQPGFADGNGTLTLRLTEDTAAFNNRIIQGALFNDQGGAVLKAYFNAIGTSGNTDIVDDSASLYCEVPIILLGFDTSISIQDDAPTEVPVNFRISDTPAHLLGLAY